MPLSKLQGEILRLLASHRNPESYVVGATVLNQDGPRFSGDIDIFYDREESVAQASEADTAYTAHGGRRKGYWPSLSEIGSAMVHDDAQKPKPC